MRVQRDIPTPQTLAGVDRTNLRQYVDEELQKRGVDCRCIRCREVGRYSGRVTKIKICVQEYDAAQGKEFFVSAESREGKVLIGFCRVRFPPRSLRKEIPKDAAVLRELHVYGMAVPIGITGSEEQQQHRGIGRRLLRKAEQIAQQAGKRKMVVISGIGVRKYYRKLGYRLQGPYMVKKL